MTLDIMAREGGRTRHVSITFPLELEIEILKTKGGGGETRTTRTAARHEHLGRVDFVVVDGVEDHVGYRLGVAAAVVAQR